MNLSSAQVPQSAPPWSGGANNPALSKGYEFHVPDIDNVPDLHGNPVEARLVLFIGGNQFFVLPKLIDEFVRENPELRGAIFYETLPPGILRRQMEAGGVITLGNLTLEIRPDVYEAGARAVHQLATEHRVQSVVEYATNTLGIMVARGNPKGIRALNDLGRTDVRLSMPNPEWEGVANQIKASLTKAGGQSLADTVYRDKVASGTTILTEIHHRQTPMRILRGEADAGVTWASEIVFQEKIGNPIAGVAIPPSENVTATYAAGVLRDAPHADNAQKWVAFLQSPQAQAIYHEYGFNSATSKH